MSPTLIDGFSRDNLALALGQEDRRGARYDRGAANLFDKLVCQARLLFGCRCGQLVAKARKVGRDVVGLDIDGSGKLSQFADWSFLAGGARAHTRAHTRAHRGTKYCHQANECGSFHIGVLSLC